MLKVNEFENGMGLSDNNKLFPFSVESNIHYRVNSLDDLINNSYETLTQIISHFITNQISLVVIAVWTKIKLIIGSHITLVS